MDTERANSCTAPQCISGNARQTGSGLLKIFPRGLEKLKAAHSAQEKGMRNPDCDVEGLLGCAFQLPAPVVCFVRLFPSGVELHQPFAGLRKVGIDGNGRAELFQSLVAGQQQRLGLGEFSLSKQTGAEQTFTVEGIPDLRVLISFAAHRFAQQGFGLGIPVLRQSQTRQCRQAGSSCKFAWLESLAIQREGRALYFVAPDESCGTPPPRLTNGAYL